MKDNIANYINSLKKELSGCDKATIQDAVSDAGEHLKVSLENLKKEQPEIDENEAWAQVVKSFGTAREIAAVYKEIEVRFDPGRATESGLNNKPWIVRFLAVITDWRAYGAWFYLIISVILGLIYAGWAMLGITISLGTLVLAIGAFFFIVFVLSIRGIALIEGRLVEALLGVRMPKRPFFIINAGSFWQKFKPIIQDRYTWLTLIYMIIKLPLGLIFGFIFITLSAVSFWSIFRPVIDLIAGYPELAVNGMNIPLSAPGAAAPFIIIGGLLLWIICLHLARLSGKLHGKLAKVMLVRNS
jgi:hypothetical protein